jgi:hypothetical protein
MDASDILLQSRDSPAPSTGEIKMTLPTNDDFAKSELSTGELETISGGLILTHGPNPPQGGHGGCNGHRPPHMEPPRYYPGGGPNSAGLNFHH